MLGAYCDSHSYASFPTNGQLPRLLITDETQTPCDNNIQILLLTNLARSWNQPSELLCRGKQNNHSGPDKHFKTIIHDHDVFGRKEKFSASFHKLCRCLNTICLHTKGYQYEL